MCHVKQGDQKEIIKHLSRSSTKPVLCVQQIVCGKQNQAKLQIKTKDLTLGIFFFFL